MSPRMGCRSFVVLACCLGFADLCFTAHASAGVSAPTVTALSNGATGTFLIENEEEALHLGTTLESGLLKIAKDRQAMIFCDADSGGARSGGVLVVLGPAEISIDFQTDRLILSLHSGRIMSSADAPQASQPVILRASLPGSPAAVEAAMGQGQTDMTVDGNQVDIAFSGVDAAAMKVLIGGAERDVASGRRLTIQGVQVQESAAEAWKTENGLNFNQVVVDLSVRSAREARLTVQGRLLDNVIAWDKYAQAENISPEPEANKPQPEIRQVVASVQSNAQRNTNRGGSPQTTSVQGANEVPSLSPAAVSVGGVTAVEVNNSKAANLLTRTQSRGLGFNGPAQLATPGFLRNGIRNVGPPGLGAQKSK